MKEISTAQSGPFSVPEGYQTEPYSFEEVRALRVDTGESIHVFPYITCREVEYKDINRTKEEGRIEIHFDRADVQITGSRVISLLTPLQRELLFSVRVGLATNPEHPQIKSIRVIPRGIEPNES